jgi:hypothetical protein
MMQRIGLLFALVGIVLAGAVALMPGPIASAQPLPPNRFFGKATASGQPAAGAAIVALVGGTNCGSATADGSGNYRLDVLSSGERPGCGTDGASVTFTVAGQRASQTGTWKQGEFTPLDLTGAAGTATATSTAAPPTATATTPPGATATVRPPTTTATAPVATATPVTPVLPRTGTGGDSGIGWLALAIAGLAALGGGAILAVRRARS